MCCTLALISCGKKTENASHREVEIPSPVVTPKAEPIAIKKEVKKKNIHEKKIKSKQSQTIDELTPVPKPDVSNLPKYKLIDHVAYSKGMKHLPFIETAPEPTVTEIEKERGYIMFSRPITKPIYLTSRPLDREKVTKLAGFGAQNEYEPLNFCIYPLRDLKNFRVIVSDLKSDKGTIGQADIDLRLGTYWKIRYPAYTSKNQYREQQELLEKVSTVSIKKNIPYRYWIDIHVPKGTPAGNYTGKITLFDDVSKMARTMPISFNVLSYELQRDPRKHNSIFYYPPHIILSKYKGALLDKALTTDMKNMQKFGIDMFPTIYINSRKLSGDKFEFYIPEDSQKVLDKGLELNFKGPIYLALMSGINRFYKHFVPDGKIGSHSGFSKMPKNNKMFKALEDASRRFVKKYKNVTRGRKFIMAVLDEPRAQGIEVTAKVYAAVRRGGIRTIVTNDPTSGYSNTFRKEDALDAWDSQPFAQSYENIQKDKKMEYWSYPNHNSGEIRDAVIMQKGGRMTYGFGFWKSGYKVLNPWAWRFFPGGKLNGQQFDYLLHERVSGCGNRLDKKGDFIPEVAWMCFREGYDDGRYLFTLQQAMTSRKHNKSKECQKLIREGKALLDEIWERIKVRRKYLKVDFFNDKSFQRLRWRMALLTEKILKFEKKSNLIAPSVMANTKQKSVEKDASYYIQKGLKDGSIEYLDLSKDSFANWKKTSDKEMRITKSEKLLKMNLKVDYKVDGKNKNGKYPIGWPYVFCDFSGHDISEYDFFYCKIKFDSTRDAVSDDVTKLNFGFKGGKFKGTTLNLGGAERTWGTVQIPIPGKEAKGISSMVILPAEHFYPDQTKIIFSISDIGFIKFKTPIIKEILSVNSLLTTDTQLDVGIDGYALDKGIKDGYSCRVSLIKNGKVIVEKTAQLTKQFNITLPIKELTIGDYQLKMDLYNKDKKLKVSSTKNINVILGY
jgi:hypothetical protein